MNIGIATFHQVYNYGAKLQQYALFKTVEQMSHTAYVLDIFDAVTQNMYHPNWGDFFRFNVGLRCYVRRAARNGVELALKPFKRDIFHAFQEEHLRLGKLPGESGAPTYDALICGSDQVWNPQVTNADPRYFLSFESPATKVRIAYAPSFGARDQVAESFLPTLTKYLSGIDVLSCREQEGCDLVEQLTHRSCPRIADPVMLLSTEEWGKVAKEPRGAPTGKYILCFDMQQTPLMKDAARTLAAKIGGTSVYFLEGHLGKKGWRSDVGPAEFIWLIQHAQCVMTNSFHGTAISLLLQKPLRVVYPTGRIARIKELLERLDLTHLLISTPDDIDRPSSWEVAKATAVIEQDRCRARDYLRHALDISRS